MRKKHKFKKNKQFKNHKFLKRAVHGGPMTYEEYLVSALWTDKKRWFEEVHPRKCVICNDIKVDLHHIVYPEIWGKEKGFHLAWMCSKHHQAFHNWIKERLGTKTLRDMKRPFHKFVYATREEEHRIFLNKPDMGNYKDILGIIKIETKDLDKLVVVTKANKKTLYKRYLHKKQIKIPGIIINEEEMARMSSKILFSAII